MGYIVLGKKQIFSCKYRILLCAYYKLPSSGKGHEKIAAIHSFYEKNL